MQLQPFLIYYAEWVSANIDLIASLALLSVALRVGTILVRSMCGAAPTGIWTLVHILVQFIPVVGHVHVIWQFVMLLGAVMQLAFNKEPK